MHALGVQHGIEPVTVEALRRVPEEVRALIPAKLAVRCNAVPVEATVRQVHVAVRDPRDLACQDELAFAVGRRLVLRAASEVRLREALAAYYDHPCDGRLAGILDRLNRRRYLWDGEGDPQRSPRGEAADHFPDGASLMPPPLRHSGLAGEGEAPRRQRPSAVPAAAAREAVVREAVASTAPENARAGPR